jgi:hypothetical protein
MKTSARLTMSVRPAFTTEPRLMSSSPSPEARMLSLYSMVRSEQSGGASE